jgi:hypothetical protein
MKKLIQIIFDSAYNNGENRKRETKMEIKRPPGPRVGYNNNFNTHTVTNKATPSA